LEEYIASIFRVPYPDDGDTHLPDTAINYKTTTVCSYVGTDSPHLLNVSLIKKKKLLFRQYFSVFFKTVYQGHFNKGQF
jgi:hypothetical protein